jgi:hypothetical protein
MNEAELRMIVVSWCSALHNVLRSVTICSPRLALPLTGCVDHSATHGQGYE